MKWLKSTKFRVRLAWTLFVGSWIGLFVSPFVLTDEPVAVLSLSWFALILTSWDIICTTELHDS